MKLQHVRELEFADPIRTVPTHTVAMLGIRN